MLKMQDGILDASRVIDYQPSEEERVREMLKEVYKNDKARFMNQVLDMPLKAFQRRALEFKGVESEGVDVEGWLWPRGAGKSYSGTIGDSIHEIVNDPNITAQIIGETETTAVLFVKAIKAQLEENEKIHDLYGQFKNRHSWSTKSLTVCQKTSNDKEPTLEAFGATGAIVARHVKIQYYDDISTPRTAGTPEQREKLWFWWRNTALPILDIGGKMKVRGTLYYPGDFYCKLREIWTDKAFFIQEALEEIEYDDYYALIEEKGLKALKTGDCCELGGPDSVARSFFHARFPTGVLLDKRRIDAASFYSQYQNSLKITGSKYVQIEQISVIEEKDLPPWNQMMLDITVDLATGEKRHHDYMSITVGGVSPGLQNIYIVYNDQVRIGDAIGQMERVFNVFRHYVDLGATVRSVSFESNFYQAILPNTMRIIPKYSLMPIQKYFTLKDKEMRMTAKASYFNSGAVKILNSCRRLIEDLCKFPNLDHDDRVDSALAFLECLTKQSPETKMFRYNVMAGGDAEQVTPYMFGPNRTAAFTTEKFQAIPESWLTFR